MNKLLEDFLKSIHNELKYPVFWYDTKLKEFGEVTNSNIKTRPIPELISSVLENNEIFSKKFIKNNEEVIFYFFRQFLEDRKIILIIQDTIEQSNLNHFVSLILKSASNNYHEYHQSERELDFMREELSECESEISVYDEKIINLEDELYEKSKELDRFKELVNILKKSRSKLMKMVDAMHLPLFSVDLEDEIINVNKALGNYLDIDDLPSFIGRKCFKVVYNKSQKCEWCKKEEVIETKRTINQHISVNFADKDYVFLQTMFPILNEEDEVIEIGEYLMDITSEYNLINTLEKSKEKLKKISRDKINKISEITTLKKEFNNLYEDYEEAKKNINKLKLALEKLLHQNTVTELLKLKTELKEFKLKYLRASETISHYEKKFNNQKNMLEELNKKSIYSMERLFNILNNKQEILEEDTKKVLEFLNSQITILKDNIFQEDSDNVSKSSD